MLTEGQVFQALKQVMDPELGVNIVDLGLVYKVNLPGDGLYIKMTTTSQACPLNNYFVNNAKKAIKKSLGMDENKITIDLVWDPPWDPDMMSEEAKSRLGRGGR